MGRPIEERRKDNEDKKFLRKTAKLHDLLYRVYVFARFENWLKKNTKYEIVDVLKTLFTWVVETQHFNDENDIMAYDQINTQVESQEVRNRFNSLLPQKKFKRYFLPLLGLICEKIAVFEKTKQCSLIFEEEVMKKIFDKFSRYRIFSELKKKEILSKFIPENIIDTLFNELSVDSFKKMQDKVGQIIDDFFKNNSDITESVTVEDQIPAIEDEASVGKQKKPK